MILSYDIQHIYKNLNTGESLGYGWVKFTAIEHAATATYAMHCTVYDLQNSLRKIFGNLCADLMVKKFV